MRLPSPEALLLSSVLNTGDLSEALGRGVCPEFFVGYRSEFEFLTRYSRDYHDTPSADVLLGVFPEFPHHAAATEVSFYSDQVIERFNHRTVKAAVLASADQLAAGDVGLAVTTMRAVQVSAAALMAHDANRSQTVADELDAEKQNAVPYPWATLQKHTGGMWPGDYCVYGARTTVGKSWGLDLTAAASAVHDRTPCATTPSKCRWPRSWPACTP